MYKGTIKINNNFNFRKQWILFPPEKSSSLLPTRTPYEESSIYSNLNFYSPDPDIANGNYSGTYKKFLSFCLTHSLTCAHENITVIALCSITSQVDTCFPWVS
jgi:hypothetical protein